MLHLFGIFSFLGIFSLLGSPTQGHKLTRWRKTRRRLVTKVLLTVLAEEAIRETELAGSLVRVSTAIVGKERVVAGGHRSHRPVVDELRTEAHHVRDPRHERLDRILNWPEEVCEALEGGEGKLCDNSGGKKGNKEDNEEKMEVEPHGGLAACALVENRGGTA